METPETRGPSRRQRVLNDLKILSLVLSHHGPSSTKTVRMWRDLRRVPQRELALYRISCKACASQDFVSTNMSWDNHTHMQSKFIRVTNLSLNCMMCDIIQQVCKHFPEDVDSRHRNIWTEYVNIAKGSEFCIDMADPIGGRRCADVYSREPTKLSNPSPMLEHNISLDPTSAQFVQKINNWINECIGTHDGCTDPMGKEQIMPGRLVRVERDIRLIEPVEPVQFVALSYCWGTSDQPKTTKANVASRCRGFSTSEFPQTLQDAISLTEKLGLSYVWIDCLCIVQDDEQDWATESAKMADIYSRAYVVLAATQARDVAEGFLRPRRPPISISSNRGRKQPTTVQARCLDNHVGVKRLITFNKYPLSERGWALQERFLATRIVHFLPDEAVFECRDQFRCECGRAGKEHETLTIWPPAANSGLPNKAAGKMDEHDFEFASEWMRVVEEYSKRHLTFADDVLPALSGVAQRTLTMRPGQYIAGIWERGLIRQLVWHSDLHSEGRKKSTSIPTFSWITASGPVLFPYLYVDYQPLCALISAQSIAATSDPFGRVTSAQISVRGLVLQGDIFVRETIESSISWVLHLDEGYCFPPMDPKGHYMEDRFVGLLTLHDWSTVVCCGLYSGGSRVCALLLKPAVDTDNYVRIGLAVDIDKESFLERATERTLTII